MLHLGEAPASKVLGQWLQATGAVHVQVHAQGRTIVLVTHAMNTVKDMCDRAIWLTQGKITLSNVRLDLKKVAIPIYNLAAKEDHIAPAKSVFNGAKFFGGDMRYVLSGSGHIAGIINPPAANKYGYWTNKKLPDQPEEWLSSATQHAGSWWTDWAQWVGGHAGTQIEPRIPGKGKYKALEDAPGSYVKRRIG